MEYSGFYILLWDIRCILSKIQVLPIRILGFTIKKQDVVDTTSYIQFQGRHLTTTHCKAFSYRASIGGKDWIFQSMEEVTSFRSDWPSLTTTTITITTTTTTTTPPIEWWHIKNVRDIHFVIQTLSGREIVLNILRKDNLSVNPAKTYTPKVSLESAEGYWANTQFTNVNNWLTDSLASAKDPFYLN